MEVKQFPSCYTMSREVGRKEVGKLGLLNSWLLAVGQCCSALLKYHSIPVQEMREMAGEKVSLGPERIAG